MTCCFQDSPSVFKGWIIMKIKRINTVGREVYRKDKEEDEGAKVRDLGGINQDNKYDGKQDMHSYAILTWLFGDSPLSPIWIQEPPHSRTENWYSKPG